MKTAYTILSIALLLTLTACKIGDDTTNPTDTPTAQNETTTPSESSEIKEKREANITAIAEKIGEIQRLANGSDTYVNDLYDFSFSIPFSWKDYQTQDADGPEASLIQFGFTEQQLDISENEAFYAIFGIEIYHKEYQEEPNSDEYFLGENEEFAFYLTLREEVEGRMAEKRLQEVASILATFNSNI